MEKQAVPMGNKTVIRYGLAILTAVAALFLRHLLSPLLGANNPYHTLWVAVVFSAWYYGVGPSVVTTLLGVVGVWYWFLPPGNTFALADPKAGITGMIGFLVFSGCIIALGETNRRSKERSGREIKERMHTEQKLIERERELERAHAELESRVRERTAELNAVSDNLRQLSARLMQAQDDERRRLARELHDSVGQLIAALGMNMGMLQPLASKLDAASARSILDSSALVDQLSREIRTISHLLHPPLLDVAGLASALRWYADGFSERSQIKVDLEIPETFIRLSSEMEIGIFRIVQECLTNIHRHSGSETARIVIRQEDCRIVVRVEDAGKGISLDRQLELSSSGRTGVGFRGMRERLRQLGGELEIHSEGSGTLVTASIPLSNAEMTSESVA